MKGEFIIENVRCFTGKQRVQIRPLTFFIGENSTGKSTLLGCYNAFATKMSMRNRLILDHKKPFGNPAYSLETFADIATDGKEKFNLGCEVSLSTDEKIGILFEFQSHVSSPVIKKMEIFCTGAEPFEIEIVEKKSSSKKFFAVKKGDGDVFVVEYLSKVYMPPLEDFLNEVMHRGFRFPFWEEGNDELKALQNLTKKNSKKIGLLYQFFNGAMANIPPIRSKPQRTYDPTYMDEEDPQKVFMELTRTQQVEKLKKNLEAFGKTSGMFDKVFVQPYGEGMNDPFRLFVKIRGVEANLIDVGYGISQSLPILVKVLHAQERRKNTFLIQQPEVHLHPRAQAELSSLFISLIGQKKVHNNFIIETHSDYMVDRAAIEIRKGAIKAEDVAVNYLKADKNNHVKVHHITFDKDGNFENTPEGYRDFFLKESDELLGFA